MDITQLEVGNEMLQHPVTDAEAPTVANFQQATVSNSVDQKVSNAEFLKALFPNLGQGEYLWTAAFATNPQEAGDREWRGNKTYFGNVQETPHGNSYFSVAALKPVKRSYKRRRENFSHMPVVVLDDSK